MTTSNSITTGMGTEDGGGLTAAAERLAGRIRAVVTSRSEAARVRRELRGLSDRSLADIGLSRCDIEAVATGTFAAR